MTLRQREYASSFHFQLSLRASYFASVCRYRCHATPVSLMLAMPSGMPLFTRAGIGCFLQSCIWQTYILLWRRGEGSLAADYSAGQAVVPAGWFGAGNTIRFLRCMVTLSACGGSMMPINGRMPRPLYLFHLFLAIRSAKFDTSSLSLLCAFHHI